MPGDLESSAASQFLTAVHKPAQAALRLVRRVVRAASRIRVAPASLPARALTRADHVPSILPVQDLPALAPADRADRVRALALAHVRDLALRVPVASAQDRAEHRPRAKLHALRVLLGRRGAVAASSTPRLKKAR
jgi:hypothetical protein